MESNKNRMEVQKIIADVIKDGLDKIGCTSSKWSIVEFGQADMFSANKVITLQFLRTNNIGWQSSKYIGKSPLNEKIEKIELQSWQVQVILKRPKEVKEESILAEDVANRLVMYLNSNTGMDKFRSKKIAPERIDTTSVFVYNDNSEIYQKRCVFTMNIEVPKEMTFRQSELTAIRPDIMPV